MPFYNVKLVVIIILLLYKAIVYYLERNNVQLSKKMSMPQQNFVDSDCERKRNRISSKSTGHLVVVHGRRTQCFIKYFCLDFACSWGLFIFLKFSIIPMLDIYL